MCALVTGFQTCAIPISSTISFLPIFSISAFRAIPPSWFRSTLFQLRPPCWFYCCIFAQDALCPTFRLHVRNSCRHIFDAQRAILSVYGGLVYRHLAVQQSRHLASPLAPQ